MFNYELTIRGVQHMDETPPPIQMVQLLSGFQVSQALYVAAKLGVADAIAHEGKTDRRDRRCR